MNFIVGKKLNMTQHFMESGEVIPVTMIKVSPMVVTQVKAKDGKDKYSAVQVGISKSIGGSIRKTKSVAGHLKDAKSVAKLFEFRVDDASGYEVGQKLDVSTFEIGEVVNAIGTMKGRGFAGAIKRHGFAGFPASHGHDRPRSVGSIGQRFPQHTRKGLRMAGHMGTQQVTVKNLQVVDVDAARGVIAIKGAVPGHRNGIVKIISTGKVKPIVIVVAEKDDKKKK
jgi:large subunit ribosomal protein L3